MNDNKKFLILSLALIFSLLGLTISVLHLYEGYELVASQLIDGSLNSNTANTVFFIMFTLTTYYMFKFFQFIYLSYITISDTKK